LIGFLFCKHGTKQAKNHPKNLGSTKAITALQPKTAAASSKVSYNIILNILHCGMRIFNLLKRIKICL